jgi:DNA mismatch repair protein MutL
MNHPVRAVLASRAVSPRIRLLPAHLANQIAAGEVVERPASVVKELVENAVDAGARTIRVEIDAGGVGRIRVTDDGTGMTRDEAVLSLERHATSKIAAVEDLESIRTLGFRGEALPSIASVARFVLRTRTPDDLAGTEVRASGGRPPEVLVIGFPVGTQVEIADLFFNTPARLKFLRSHATESGHAIEAAVRIALAHPGVALTIVRDGKVARELLRQTGRASRVREAFPDEPLYGAEGNLEGIAVQGWLGAPHRARAGASGLYTFVNGRHVRDKSLLRAVVQAFAGTLESGRYPMGAVYLDLDPREVDVNVHPQKSEVRFARQGTVIAVTTRILQEALRAAPWARPSFATAAAGGQAAGAHATWSDGRGRSAAGGGGTYAGGVARSLFGAGVEAVRGLFDPPPSPQTDFFRTDAAVPAAADDCAATVAAVPEERRGLYSSLQPVGQVRCTYIVCEGPEGLYILDQHASHERVTFDRLRRSFLAHEVAVQRLLFPERVELDPTLVAVAIEHRDALAALGIDAEPLGASSLALRSVPALVSRADPRRLLVDVLTELGSASRAAFTAAVDLVVATMACHGSVRAGDRLAPEEVRALLLQLDDVDFSGNCPHGRPILMTLSWADLERRVGRR